MFICFLGRKESFSRTFTSDRPQDGVRLYVTNRATADRDCPGFQLRLVCLRGRLCVEKRAYDEKGYESPLHVISLIMV